MLSHYHNFEAVENVHFVFTSMVLHIHVWSLYAVLIPFFFISKESSMVNVLIYQQKKKKKYGKCFKIIPNSVFGITNL